MHNHYISWTTNFATDTEVHLEGFENVYSTKYYLKNRADKETESGCRLNLFNRFLLFYKNSHYGPDAAR